MSTTATYTGVVRVGSTWRNRDGVEVRTDDLLRRTYLPASACPECGAQSNGGRCFKCRGESMQ